MSTHRRIRWSKTVLVGVLCFAALLVALWLMPGKSYVDAVMHFGVRQIILGQDASLMMHFGAR